MTLHDKLPVLRSFYQQIFQLENITNLFQLANTECQFRKKIDIIKQIFISLPTQKWTSKT